MGMYLQVIHADPEDLKRLRADAETLEPWIEAAEPDDVDLGKDWDLIGRLVMGGDPGGLMVFGEPLGDVDYGYGPPLLVEGAELERLIQVLGSHDRSTVLDYLQSDDFEMDRPYPYQNHTADEDEEVAGWCGRMLDELRALAATARSGGGGLILLLA